MIRAGLMLSGLAGYSKPGNIEGRQEEQRQDRADDNAAHHRVGHRPQNI